MNSFARAIASLIVSPHAKPAVIAALNVAIEATTEQLDQLRSAVIQRLLPRLAAFTLDGVAERRQDGRLEFHDLLVLAHDVEDVQSAMATTGIVDELS